jgi:hypothetical protein
MRTPLHCSVICITSSRLRLFEFRIGSSLAGLSSPSIFQIIMTRRRELLCTKMADALKATVSQVAAEFEETTAFIPPFAHAFSNSSSRFNSVSTASLPLFKTSCPARSAPSACCKHLAESGADQIEIKRRQLDVIATSISRQGSQLNARLSWRACFRARLFAPDGLFKRRNRFPDNLLHLFNRSV